MVIFRFGEHPGHTSSTTPILDHASKTLRLAVAFGGRRIGSWEDSTRA